MNLISRLINRSGLRISHSKVFSSAGFLLYLSHLSQRFKNFCSSHYSFNPILRPNSNDSFCHVIDSYKIFGSTLGVRPNEKNGPWNAPIPTMKIRQIEYSTWAELKTLEWWISGLMLNPLFFLISRLNIACSPLIFNLQINYPIRIKDIPF